MAVAPRSLHSSASDSPVAASKHQRSASDSAHAVPRYALYDSLVKIFGNVPQYYEAARRKTHAHFAAPWRDLMDALAERTTERFSDFFVDTEDFDFCRNNVWVRFRRSTSAVFWSVKSGSTASFADAQTAQKYITYAEKQFEDSESVLDYLKKKFPAIQKIQAYNSVSSLSVLSSYNVVRTSGKINSHKVYVDVAQLSYTDFYVVGSIEMDGPPSLPVNAVYDETFHGLPSKAVEAFRCQNPTAWARLGETARLSQEGLLFGLSEDSSDVHVKSAPFGMTPAFDSFPLLANQRSFFLEDKDDYSSEREITFLRIDEAEAFGQALCAGTSTQVVYTVAPSSRATDSSSIPGRIFVRNPSVGEAERVAERLKREFADLRDYFVSEVSKPETIAEEFNGACCIIYPRAPCDTLEEVNFDQAKLTSLGFTFRRQDVCYGITAAHGCEDGSTVFLSFTAEGQDNFAPASCKAVVVYHNSESDIAILEIEEFERFLSAVGVKMQTLPLLDNNRRGKAANITEFCANYKAASLGPAAAKGDSFQAFGVRTNSLQELAGVDVQKFANSSAPEEEKWIHLEGYSQRGDSGGLVMSARDRKVCGIVKGGVPTPRLDLTFAIPHWLFPPTYFQGVGQVEVPLLPWGLLYRAAESPKNIEEQPSASSSSSSSAPPPR